MIKTDGTKYYAYRCINREDDALDFNKSECRRLDDGRINGIDRYVFKSSVISDDENFCLISGTFYTEKFKRRVEAAGLKGGSPINEPAAGAQLASPRDWVADDATPKIAGSKCKVDAAKKQNPISTERMRQYCLRTLVDKRVFCYEFAA